MTVRVGVVGRGFMGSMHLNAYAKLPGVEVAAVCDKRKAVLTPNARTTGNLALGTRAPDLSRTQWYTQLDRMLAETDLDVVDITLPTHLHADAALEAFKAGKHVICEKPLARNSRDAERIVSAAEKAGRRLFVGHCIRYWPAYAKARDMIRSGKYRKVLSARFVRLSPALVRSSDNWMMDHERSGDAALDVHIHDSDFVLYTFGAPEAVVSHGTGFGLSKERLDHIMTVYEYPDGKLVTAEGSWIYAQGFNFQMQFSVALEKATLECGPDLRLKLHSPSGKSSTVRLPTQDGYTLELRDFLSCIRKGKPCEVVTPESALQTIKLVEAEIKSALTGRRVAVKL